MRWEWYGVPYLGNGMTAGFKGGGLSAFGLSGRGFDTWLSNYNWNPGNPVTDAYKNCVDASGTKDAMRTDHFVIYWSGFTKSEPKFL